MSNEKIQNVKEKILQWLAEERYETKEVVDTASYFNIDVSFKSKTLGGGFNIIQPLKKMDSVAIVHMLELNEYQKGLLNKLNALQKPEYFWNLRFAYLRMPDLMVYQILPNPPDNVDRIMFQSRPLFYDSLTKADLFAVIFSLNRAVFTSMFILEHMAGLSTAKDTSSQALVRWKSEDDEI